MVLNSFLVGKRKCKEKYKRVHFSFWVAAFSIKVPTHDKHV